MQIAGLAIIEMLLLDMMINMKKLFKVYEVIPQIVYAEDIKSAIVVAVKHLYKTGTEFPEHMITEIISEKDLPYYSWGDAIPYGAALENKTCLQIINDIKETSRSPNSTLKVGDRVKTAYGITKRDYSDEAMLTRRGPTIGTIIKKHNSHGLCYSVYHDVYDDIGCYDPDELKLIDTK